MEYVVELRNSVYGDVVCYVTDGVEDVHGRVLVCEPYGDSIGLLSPHRPVYHASSHWVCLLLCPGILQSVPCVVAEVFATRETIARVTRGATTKSGIGLLARTEGVARVEFSGQVGYRWQKTRGGVLGKDRLFLGV